jgi:hypothetical protein
VSPDSATEREAGTLKKVLKYSFLGLALAVGASAAAHADSWNHDPHRQKLEPRTGPRIAPEVDPTLAISGLSLLAGTLTVLRARGRK